MFYMANTDANTNKVLSYADALNKLQAAMESNTTKLLDYMAQIDKYAMTQAKSMGIGVENITRMKSAVSDVRDYLADLNMDIEAGYKMIGESATSVGRNIILSTEGQKDLAAAMAVTGKNAKDIVGPMKDVGISANQAGAAMDKVVNSARQIGVNSSETVAMVLKNVSKLNEYNFQGGVDGLAKMAAQAVSLRIDMSETMKAAEKAFNPDGAIQMAASLQRLGVTQSELLDPINLMNLAENDPAELQNQLAEMSKQFVRMNKDGQFEIMPGAKRKIREIEKALNLSTGTLSKMGLASAELEDKMKRINFGGSFSDEEKKFIANMAEMGKDGEYVLRVDGKELRMDEAINKLQDPKALKKFMEDQKPKSMEKLAESQLDMLSQINSGILKMTGKVAAGASGTQQGEDIVRSMGAGMKKSYDELGNALYGTTDQIKKAFEGQKGKELAENVKTIFTDTIDDVEDVFTVFLKGGKAIAQTLNTLLASQEYEGAREKKAALKRSETFDQTSIDAELKDLGVTIAGTFKSLFKKIGLINDGIVQDGNIIQTGENDMLFAVDKNKDMAVKAATDPFGYAIEALTNMKTTKEPGTTIMSPSEANITMKVIVEAPNNVDKNVVTEAIKTALSGANLQELYTKLQQVPQNYGATPLKK